MGEHLTMERYYWFDNRVRAGRFPNARDLAERFEISSKTAQRTIDFMRDRLRAPLEYRPRRRGYRYTDHSFCLPPFQGEQKELVAVLLARNLLSGSAGGIISDAIHSFGRKLLAAMGEMGLGEEKLMSAFSAVWNGHAPAPAATFRQVVTALLADRLLGCRYTSPAGGERTDRTIEPHHLQHYMGSWVLIGWCRLRNDWRKFFLSRMSEPVATDESFDPRPEAQWKPLIHASFGIFQGGVPVRVTLRFNRFRTPWIREQLWHPSQRIQELPGGGMLLTLPVTDFREIRMRILQFGADVEVLEPGALRDEVRDEIGKMGKLYGQG